MSEFELDSIDAISEINIFRSADELRSAKLNNIKPRLLSSYQI